MQYFQNIRYFLYSHFCAKNILTTLYTSEWLQTFRRWIIWHSLHFIFGGQIHLSNLSTTSFVSQILANSATSKWTHRYTIRMTMKLGKYDHLYNRHTHPRDQPHIFLASGVRKNHAITVYFGHRLETQLPSIALSSHSTNPLLRPNKAIWENRGFLWVTDATVISSSTLSSSKI